MPPTRASLALSFSSTNPAPARPSPYSLNHSATLPQPLRHAAVMRAGPLAGSTEAERPILAVGCSARGRLPIRGARGRWDPLPLGIDVAAPLRRRGLRRLGGEKLFE